MIEEYGVEEYLLDIQEDLQNKEYRPKPVKSYGKSNSGAAWFGLEDSLRASSEPWIRQRIYAKLNGKLKEQGKNTGRIQLRNRPAKKECKNVRWLIILTC